MKIILPLLAVCLVGCASTSSVLTEAPAEVIRSTKNQTEVAFCLANKWDAAALDHPSGAKVIVVKSVGGIAAATLSVFADGTGSRTELRKGAAPFGLARTKSCY